MYFRPIVAGVLLLGLGYEAATGHGEPHPPEQPHQLFMFEPTAGAVSGMLPSQMHLAGKEPGPSGLA